MKKFVFFSLVIASFSTLIAGEKMGVCDHCGRAFSDAFVEVVDRCGPAVVYIEAELGHPRETAHYHGFSKSNPFEEFQDDLLEKFFGIPGKRDRHSRPQPGSTGSGFLVSSDGYIVTNHHVVKDAQKITVEIYDGGERSFSPKL